MSDSKLPYAYDFCLIWEGVWTGLALVEGASGTTDSTSRRYNEIWNHFPWCEQYNDFYNYLICFTLCTNASVLSQMSNGSSTWVPHR